MTPQRKLTPYFCIGRVGLALFASTVACVIAGLYSGSASAASTAVFSRGIGTVLPNAGDRVEVSLRCPGHARGACRGSVALMPRGQTALKLGSGAVASHSFSLAHGADADLLLRLSAPAHAALAHGPLFVTTVLGRSGASTRAARRREVIASEQPVDIGPPTVTRFLARAASAGAVEFTWNKTIPAGKILVMRRFQCPSDAPRVAQGKMVGLTQLWPGKIEASASDGTGYAGFDEVVASDPFRGAGGDWVNMLGWPEGSFFRNSIWAPLSKAGHFSLRVTCTDAAPFDAARAGVLLNVRDYPVYHEDPARFFPWKN